MALVHPPESAQFGSMLVNINQPFTAHDLTKTIEKWFGVSSEPD
ncbi:MAG: hypothetical protein AAFQ95_25570 [Cyanobacteria bacterium J06621_3]